ncbi:hypothetical protein D3C74_435820 [compost metagenome]
MRHLIFVHRLNDFKERCYSCFIIRAEDGCSIASNPAIFTDNRLNAVAWRYSIHMAGK